jgi:hypothetical protein
VGAVAMRGLAATGSLSVDRVGEQAGTGWEELVGGPRFLATGLRRVVLEGQRVTMASGRILLSQDTKWPREGRGFLSILIFVSTAGAVPCRDTTKNFSLSNKSATSTSKVTVKDQYLTS